MSFQMDRIEAGGEAYYSEDGAHYRVLVKEKRLEGDYMNTTLTILEVYNGPTLHNMKPPEVGSDLFVSEYQGAGAMCGWNIQPA